MSEFRHWITQGFGGMTRAQGRILVIKTQPMPQAPGVDAMLDDGWVWDGRRFARDQQALIVWSDSVVAFEGPRLLDRPVFVRTGPTGDGRVGQFRCDDAQGHAVEVAGARWLEFIEPVNIPMHSAGGGLMSGVDGGWRARITRPTTRAPGRFAGYVSGARVKSGRYQDRLPTNRKRKRVRAKGARRARSAAARFSAEHTRLWLEAKDKRGWS